MLSNLPQNIITSTLLVSCDTPLDAGSRYRLRIDVSDARANEGDALALFATCEPSLDAPSGILCRRAHNEARPASIERQNRVRVLTLELENVGNTSVTLTDCALSLTGIGMAPRAMDASDEPQETLAQSESWTVTARDGVAMLTAAVERIRGESDAIPGAQGAKGDTGDAGPQGATGAKGDKGDAGNNGLAGATGAAGVKGDTGAQGPQGVQGVKGDTGDTGAQGIQGVKGDTGLTGPSGASGNGMATGTLISSNTSVTTGNTVVSTTAETTFSPTGVLAANSLVVGQVITVELAGVYSTAMIAPTLRGKVKLNGDTVLDSGAISAIVSGAVDKGWTGKISFIVQSLGVSGTLEAQGMLWFGGVMVPIELKNTAPVAINTTIAQTISMTAQWGAAASFNSITIREFTTRADTKNGSANATQIQNTPVSAVAPAIGQSLVYDGANYAPGNVAFDIRDVWLFS